MNSIVVYCVSVSCPSFIIFSFDGSLLFLNFVLVSIFLFFFSLICCVRFVSEWLFSHILPSCVRWNTTVMANCYGTNCYIKCVTPVLKLYNLVEFEKFSSAFQWCQPVEKFAKYDEKIRIQIKTFRADNWKTRICCRFLFVLELNLEQIGLFLLN